MILLKSFKNTDLVLKKHLSSMLEMVVLVNIFVENDLQDE